MEESVPWEQVPDAFDDDDSQPVLPPPPPAEIAGLAPVTFVSESAVPSVAAAAAAAVTAAATAAAVATGLGPNDLGLENQAAVAETVNAPKLTVSFQEYQKILEKELAGVAGGDLPDGSAGPLVQLDNGSLSCVGLGITMVPFALSRVYGSITTVLNLSSNRIAQIPTGILAMFSQLTDLVLDNNELRDDLRLPPLPTLKTLSLNNNGIARLKRFLDELRGACPSLEFLSLLLNPCCPLGSDEKYTRYRLLVLARLPGLRFLDSSRVTAEELEASEELIGLGEWFARRFSFRKKQEKTTLERRLSIDVPQLPNRDIAKIGTAPKQQSCSEYLPVATAVMNHGASLPSGLRFVALEYLAERWLVAGASNGIIYVYDTAPGHWQHTCVGTLKGHSGGVYALLYLEAIGLLSSGADRVVRAWDLAKEVCIASFPVAEGTIVALAPLHKPTWFAMAAETTIKIWDAASDAVGLGPRVTLVGHSARVECLAGPTSVSVDAIRCRQLVSGDSLGNIKVWDAEAGVCVTTLSGHHGPVVAVLLLVAQNRVLTGSADGTIKRWDLDAAQHRFTSISQVHDALPRNFGCASTILAHASGVRYLYQLADGRFVSSGADRCIALWDGDFGADGGTLKQVIGEHTSAVDAVIELDAGVVVSAATDIKVWGGLTSFSVAGVHVVAPAPTQQPKQDAKTAGTTAGPRLGDGRPY